MMLLRLALLAGLLGLVHSWGGHTPPSPTPRTSAPPTSSPERTREYEYEYEVPVVAGGDWKKCSSDGDWCECTGRARYGYPARPKDFDYWITKFSVDGRIKCSVKTFGGDPIPAAGFEPWNWVRW